mmetsp:Transcript_19957/g.46437  ORF Transcript_19957/g.46437 Transcript_19957/m.46437 type:complete len:691 (+) Transcript_19957:91-2163(+)
MTSLPKYAAVALTAADGDAQAEPARSQNKTRLLAFFACGAILILLVVLLVVAEVLTVFAVPTPPGGLLGYCLLSWEPEGHHSWEDQRRWHVGDVEELMMGMTLREKIAQMLSVEEMQSRCGEAARLGIGSVMWGANGHPGSNRPEEWRDLLQTLQKQVLRSGQGVPLLYAIDSVHGNSHVRYSVMFPHNIGLGSAQNESLVEAIGAATAHDSADLGFSWIYAPCVAVVHDLRWGRTFESFSQDASVVASLAAAYVRGVRRSGRPVMSTAKHFVGDGASRWGTGHHGDIKNKGIDRGDAILTPADLKEQLTPFRAVVEAGVDSIMVSYGSVNGTKMHRHSKLLDIVRSSKDAGGLGFQGLVVSDYGGVDMLGNDYELSIREAVSAGIDVVMVTRPLECGTGWNCPRPDDTITTIERLVQEEKISEARVEEASRRVLNAKLDIGLFTAPIAPEEPVARLADTRALAREAASQSVVLLQSTAGVLPLRPDIPGRRKLCVAGAAAADLGLQCGGWTLTWQGSSGTAAALGTSGVTVWDAAQALYGDEARFEPTGVGCADADQDEVVLAVIAEEPYAEYLGDVQELHVRHEDVAMLDTVVQGRASKKVLLSLAGRPLPIDRWLPHFDAVMMASLPGTEGGLGIWDVLSGAVQPRGRLPFVWPREGAQMPLLPSEQNVRSSEVLFALGSGSSSTAS